MAAAVGPTVAPLGCDRAPPTIDSHDLLDGRVELYIRHGADVYRLRLTRNNKLILTK